MDFEAVGQTLVPLIPMVDTYSAFCFPLKAKKEPKPFP